MKEDLFTYIRVSTGRQAQHGVSLPEQQEWIERYAKEFGLPIGKRFEEHETAAVRGRPVFNQLLKELHAGHARGVVFYEVDRSSRNSTDWAKIEELSDRGLEVHFARERLLLARRGDRMIAGVKAVMAADFIRHHRERITTSFYGRLKQGLLPRPAPVGYLDAGRGQPKAIDPVKGPLVRSLFEAYATGQFNLPMLADEAERIRLLCRNGLPMRFTQLAKMLRNPFYAGVNRIRKTGQSFPGIHPPLITVDVFQRVQNILDGRMPKFGTTHDFQFRRLLTCAHCEQRLIGERQKGHVYYRCHTANCPTTTVREEVVEGHLEAVLTDIRFAPRQHERLLSLLAELRQEQTRTAADLAESRRLRIAQLDSRRKRLTDLYFDGGIERPEFEQRKETLLLERQGLEKAELDATGPDAAGALMKFLELAKHAHLLYEHATRPERRDLIEIVTSNRFVDGRKPHFTLASPFAELSSEVKHQHGASSRGTTRTKSTVERLLSAMVQFLAKPAAKRLIDRVATLLPGAADTKLAA